MDDSPGEVGLRLASSTADTALSLGHIATPRKKGEAVHRGTGVELRTEGAAVLRAAQGLLLTTFGAAKEAPHLAHTELSELIGRCHELTRALAAAVEKAGGHRPSTEASETAQRALATWPGTAGADKRDTSPTMALASANDIVIATPESQSLYAGKHLNLAADADMHLASGEHAHVTAGRGVTVHACEGGIDLRAANGPVGVEATQGDMRLTARQAVTVTSHDDEIVLSGRTIKLIAGDGSYIRLGEGVQVGSPGECLIDVKRVHFDPPRSLDRLTEQATTDGARQRARFTFPDIHPMAAVSAAGWAYTLRREDGSEQTGTVDDDGLTEWLETDTVAKARMEANAHPDDDTAPAPDAGEPA
jgi:type VI secretion system secreted protein VgrG